MQHRVGELFSRLTGKDVEENDGIFQDTTAALE
jgi:hypothetical protein